LPNHSPKLSRLRLNKRFRLAGYVRSIKLRFQAVVKRRRELSHEGWSDRILPSGDAWSLIRIILLRLAQGFVRNR